MQRILLIGNAGAGKTTFAKQLAQKLNIPFVDSREWNIDLAFDGVHFTEEGHHTFANHLAEYL